jgi:hypothetical protein
MIPNNRAMALWEVAVRQHSVEQPAQALALWVH